MEGITKEIKSSSNGNDIITNLASAGNLLGHRSVFTHKNYDTTLTAVEDTKVCFIDKSDIVDLVKTNQTIAFNLITYLEENIEKSETKKNSLCQRTVFERTCETLLSLKEKYGKPEDETGKTLINIKLTRGELASLVWNRQQRH